MVDPRGWRGGLCWLTDWRVHLLLSVSTRTRTICTEVRQPGGVRVLSCDGSAAWAGSHQVWESVALVQWCVVIGGWHCGQRRQILGEITTVEKVPRKGSALTTVCESLCTPEIFVFVFTGLEIPVNGFSVSLGEFRRVRYS